MGQRKLCSSKVAQKRKNDLKYVCVCLAFKHIYRSMMAAVPHSKLIEATTTLQQYLWVLHRAFMFLLGL